VRGLPGALLAIWFATSSGCAARPQVLVADSARVTVMNVESLTAQYPLGRTENIKSAPLARTAALSTHFVQIRDREAPHAHARHDLVVMVLRGTGNIYVRGVPTRMRPGDVAVIPRGTPHYFVNTGNDPAAALATFAPPFDGTDQVPVAD
jgi:mannose-6-phosphate isomerase-like protein (cupin superfamily)